MGANEREGQGQGDRNLPRPHLPPGSSSRVSAALFSRGAGDGRASLGAFG